MKIKFKKTTGWSNRHPYCALPLLIGLMVFMACGGGASDKPADATPVQQETATRPASQSTPGEPAETPAANPSSGGQSAGGASSRSADQPVPGNPAGEAAADPGSGGQQAGGSGAGSAPAPKSAGYTVLDWRGGVTVKGNTPQKGQKTQKDQVRFSKTSDALMVTDEKDETFFILPEGYTDEEGDGKVCSAQQCDPVLMPARGINRNMKRLRDWLHIKSQIPRSEAEPGVKFVEPTTPRAGEANPGIKRPPATIQQGQIQKENLNKKEIQKVKNIRQ